MANEVVVIINAETGEAEKKIDKVKDSVKGVSKETEKTQASFSAFGDVADSVSGGMITGFRGARASLGGLTNGFKGLRAAIISTGIGALIVLLGSLAAWFTSSEKGATALKNSNSVSFSSDTVPNIFPCTFRGVTCECIYRASEST